MAMFKLEPTGKCSYIVRSQAIKVQRHAFVPFGSIVTAFAIEPYDENFGENSPNKGIVDPIQALMTTYSYIVPYPKQNRFSVWFIRGSLDINDGADK